MRTFLLGFGMVLHPLFGHEAARKTIAHALRTDRLPQVLLIVGEDGVGKQRLGLWVAQMALCQAPGEEPCGTCQPCHLTLTLGHPDLHWFIPVLRPKAFEPDKQLDEVAEAIAEVLAERRTRSLYGPRDGMTMHGVAAARLIQRHAALTTVLGGRKVFLIGNAERLVPQESSPEAANTLLKLLEEPSTGSIFLLTARDATGVLPTIRSRSAPLRLGRLRDEDVAAFLSTHMDPPLKASEVAERVAAAEGSIGHAIAGGAAATQGNAAAVEVLEAVFKGAGPQLERSLRQNPWQARGEFTTMLDSLADLLGEAARAATGERPRRPVPERLLSAKSPARLSLALDRVQVAREAAQGNVNPQLLLAVLTTQLAEVL